MAGDVRVQVEPRRLEVVPGDPVALQIQIYNSRNIIDAYSVTLLGLDADTGGAGVSVVTEPPSLSLFPETEGTLTVLFTLPLGFPAGTRTVGVATVSTTDAAVSVVEDIELAVAPVHELSMEVQPQSVTGGGRALFGITVENRGNVPADLTLRASDAERLLSSKFERPHLVAPPASTVRSRLAVAGRRPLLGSPAPRIITVAAEESGGQSLEAVATFIQKPLIPRALLTLAAVVGALALWASVLFQGVDRAVEDVAQTSAQAEAAAAGSGVIAGTVSGPSGPLGGVTVTLSGAAEATTTSPTEGDVGAYRFAELATPGAYVLTFAKDGYESQTFAVELAEDEVVTGRDVELTVATGSITGTVVDEAGAPVGGVAVTVAPAAPDGTDSQATDAAPSSVGAASQAMPTAVTMETGSVGLFNLTGLPVPGDYVLTFSKDGFAPVTQAVTLAAEGGGAEVSPTLARVRTASVSGLVRADRLQTTPCTPAECGLGGVQVEVSDGQLSVAAMSATSPAPGRYQVTDLPAGAFTVTFTKAGFQVQTVEVQVADGQQLQLDVALAGDPGALSGAAVGCTSVELRLSDLSPLAPPRSEALDVAGGDFTFAALRTPALYRVVFRGPEIGGFRDVQVIDVELGPGAVRADLDVTCDADAPTAPASDREAPPPPPVLVNGSEEQEAGLLSQLIGQR